MTKKKKRIRFLFRFIFTFLFLFAVYFFTYYLLSLKKMSVTNEEFLKILLEDSSHLIQYEKNSKSIVNKITKTLSNLDITSPLSILESNFHYKAETEEYDPTSTMSIYISNPNEKSTSPRVYIYNSHQLESYQTISDSITPNVLMASYLLEEKLNTLGIPTLTEEGDITELMRVNGWKHSDSYKASRFYLEDASEKNSTLEFYIDLHRDAIKKDASTTTINQKNYAKILFVVGTDHENYKKNLNLANTLNSLVKEKYPTLTRGVLTHGGKGYNGIYNQDFSPNMILLECGGYENTIEEVENTLELFASILKDYLGETYERK